MKEGSTISSLPVLSLFLIAVLYFCFVYAFGCYQFIRHVIIYITFETE